MLCLMLSKSIVVLAESEILQTLALRQFPCRGVGAQHEFQMHLAIVLS